MGENLVFEASKFMLLGMTTVLFFLLIMIFFLNIQSYIINNYFISKNPKISAVDNNIKNNISIQKDEEISEEIAAVISVAVKKFRQTKK